MSLLARIFVAFAAAIAAVTAPTASAVSADAAAERTLPTRLARALAVPHVDASRSAAIAVDLTTGQVVYRRNPMLSLAPASTEKLALSFTLLSRLGPVYRIETRVLGSGALDGATWHGDVVLEGAPPSALDPPSGCPFHTRCPRKLGAICETELPPERQAGADHMIFCHIPLDELRAIPPVFSRVDAAAAE